MSTSEIKRHAEMAAHYEPFQRFMYAIGFARARGLFDDALYYYADFSRLPETGVKYGEQP